MKNKKQLKEYYEKKLVPVLRRYENIRVSIIRKTHYLALALVVVALAGAAALVIFPPTHYKGLALLPIIGAVNLLPIIRKYYASSYNTFFKDDIIQRIIKFVEPEFEYESRGVIEEPLYNLSRLFPENYNRYRGSDLVKGQIGKTKFQFSWLHTEYIGIDSKEEEDENTYGTIFKGILFMGDFNKDFDGYTQVVPRGVTNLRRPLAKYINNWDLQAKPVKLEDPEFGSMFNVYGSDQIESRYILTPGLMERIKNYKQRTGKEIALSFSCTFVFAAISMEEEIFEPKLYESLLNFRPIEEYYENLMLAVSIIEELNLNLRIWSKN